MKSWKLYKCFTTSSKEKLVDRNFFLPLSQVGVGNDGQQVEERNS